MTYIKAQLLIETTIVALIGGYLFNLANLPLPWVLGALTFVMLWQGVRKKNAYVPQPFKNGGFIILGMYFGLYFTAETFRTIGPYFLPYIIMTCVLIAISILLATAVTKWIDVDRITSVFGSIPGGLSEMVIASEALNAKSSLVVIFQTVRMMTVLFIVPPVMIYLFSSVEIQGTKEALSNSVSSNILDYLWFILPITVGLLLRKKIPAGIIIGALGITAIMNISPIDLPTISPILMNAAQVAVGASLGKNILFKDLKIGGKYCFIYFGLSIVLITIAFCLGIILANITTLNYATAILSIAPGGLFEMVLTAYNVGGDPAIVSALQLVRILVIVVFVPPVLGWAFKGRKRKRLVEKGS